MICYSVLHRNDSDNLYYSLQCVLIEFTEHQPLYTTIYNIYSSRLAKMVDVSQYKVGVVLSLEGCGGKCANGKALKACRVNVTGDEANPATIVTSASNVRTGSRVVVALAGTSFLNGEGDAVTVQKTAVGGVMSDGMFCDSRMLGWSGGGSGVAAQVPDSFEIGSAPPSSKPRPKEAEEPAAPTEEAKGLFEKKLSKEEKKKLAEERRKARKAAKEAKKEGAEGDPTEGQ
jgi:tRNA-binding EMAP/Myf-like protein